MTEAELERKIKKVYSRAYAETNAKFKDYLMQFDRLDKQWKKDVRAGRKTLSEYNEWKKGKIAMGERWSKMTGTLANDMLNADNEARSIIQDYLPEAFAEGFNFACYEMATAMGNAYMNGSFTLYDKKAVQYIIKENPDLLPQLKPNSPTAEKIRNGEIIRWNKQKINAEVTQGILQGESMTKIASRMENVVGMEERSAIRNARTATNGAHNAGKENSFKEAQDLGIDVQQMWLAALDDRTRATHRQLDGQIRKIGEKFECRHKLKVYEIEYPCDPTAAPEMVYNCRCTLIPYLPEYDKGSLELRYRDTSKMTQASYEEWKKAQPVYKTDNKKSKTEASEKATSKKVVAKATNRDEAKKVLHDIGFKHVNGTDKVSERLLVDNANRLAELNNRFGAITPDMKLVAKEFTGEFEDAVAYVDAANHKVGSSRLLINTSDFGNTRTLRRDIIKGITKDSDGSFYSMPVSKEYYNTAYITHEYGHILQNHLYGKAGIYKREGKHTNERYSKAAEDTYYEIFDIAIKKNPHLDVKGVMSEYSGVNTNEFFAECFMNAFCGAPNELGLAMLEWLKRKGL